MKFGVIGDVHGNWNSMMRLIEHRDIRDTVLIQLGDFGVGFIEKNQDRKNVEAVSERLKALNIMMYVIRGNHDNPDYFDGSWEFSNLKLVKDYTVITVDGDDILLVGGAISIDRKPRLAEMTEYAKYGKDRESYWYDENFVLDKERAHEIKGCRYVITHTSPDFCWPDNKNGFGPLVEHFILLGDKKLRDELPVERRNLTKLYNILKENNVIEKWFYGHFHRTELTEKDGTDFHLLDINEIHEVR